jgi:N-acetylmuramoyl-L-alanine amidase
MFNQTVFAATLTQIQVLTEADKTRVVFALSKEFSFTSSRLSNPERLVLDIRKAQWKAAVDQSSLFNTPIKRIRQSQRDNGVLRVVLDLESDIRSQQSKQVLDDGGRLVVVLSSRQSRLSRAKVAIKTEAAKAVVAASPSPITTPNPVLAFFTDPGFIESTGRTEQQPRLATPPFEREEVDTPSVHAAKNSVVFQSNQNLSSKKLRNVVVAIDPGHGGGDSGAIGLRGTQEKKVVLEIARALQARINQQPGMRAVLTRNGDYFVELARRRYIARQQHNADIFISIHADAFSDRSARGASVFVLSRKGASSTLGAFLAKNENAADQFGGLKVASDDKVLRSVLADLAMEGSLEHSFRVGEAILSRLQKVGTLHNNRVEQAAFMVLKSLDIPSVLVETGFISNPDEEQKLAQKHYQERLANALFLAIRSYFETHPLPGTYMAMADAR